MKLHQDFKINGNSFTKSGLHQYASELHDSTSEYLQDIAVFLEDWFNDTPYIKVNTSGSTGTPKQIKLSKAHMVNSALATREFFSCYSNTKALLCLSANYIAGKMMLVRAMVLGWDIHFVKPTNNPLSKSETQFDFVAMVPMQVQNSLANLHKVKQLIIGGAPVSNVLENQLQQLTTKCYATYGMTETITHIAVKKLNHFSSVISKNSEKSHYHILSDVSISKDERDCLVIDAPKVSEETVKTNDIVKIHSLNSFEWLGRYDSIINSGGVKLFPEQIEKKLSALISDRFFVAGITDQHLGQKLVLLIENKLEYDKEYLLLKIKNLPALSKFEVPKSIYVLPNFIETPTGKIQRKQTLALV